MSLTDAVLYTTPEKVTPDVAEHLREGGVTVKPYEQLVSDVRAKAAAKAKIAMDFSKVSDCPRACWFPPVQADAARSSGLHSGVMAACLSAQLRGQDGMQMPYTLAVLVTCD